MNLPSLCHGLRRPSGLLAAVGTLVLRLTALADNSWPMLGHDALRSGASTETIHPPFQRRWYRNFAEEGLMQGIQPVVAQGRVFIGTMHGRLHALDEATGRDLWVVEVPGGVFHAAALADGLVFVCSGHGCLHAMEAATGKARWVFSTSTGLASQNATPASIAIWNAPLPFADRVYFSGRDIAALNGDKTKTVLALRAKPGETIAFSCADSTDLDGHALKQTWFIYPEAGT